MGHEAFYALIEAAGYSTGRNFRCIREIRKGEGEAVCLLQATSAIDPAAVHPGLIDSILQTVLPACERSASKILTGDKVLIPLHMGSVHCSRAIGEVLTCHTRVEVADGLVKADIAAFGPGGAPVLEIRDFLLKQTDQRTLYQDAGEDEQKLIYTTGWRELEIERLARDPAADTEVGWIIFSEAGRSGEALAAEVCRRGFACLELMQGSRFGVIGHDKYILDGSSPLALPQLLSEWIAGRRFASLRVVFCWQGQSDSTRGQVFDDVQREPERLCGSLIDVVHAVAAEPTRAQTRLWVITEQAHIILPDDGAAAAPAGRALWALGRSIAQEFPEFWGGLVDVESRSSGAAVAALLDVLPTSGEDQVAVRRGKIYGARLRSWSEFQAGRARRTPDAAHRAGSGVLPRRGRAPYAGRSQLQAPPTSCSRRAGG